MKFLSQAMRPFACLLLAFVCGLAGCDIPVLENPQCTEARNSIREFYSYHFGGRTSGAPEQFQARDQFVTPQLLNAAAASSDTGVDYFTATENDFPKAFRVGACTAADNSRAEVDVLLFWKDDVRSEQRTIRVETIHNGERWLINKVTDK